MRALGRRPARQEDLRRRLTALMVCGIRSRCRGTELQSGSEGLDRQEHRPAFSRKEDEPVLEREGHGIVIDCVNHKSPDAGGPRDPDGALHCFLEHRRADAFLLVTFVDGQAAEHHHGHRIGRAVAHFPGYFGAGDATGRQRVVADDIARLRTSIGDSDICPR